MKGNFFVVRIKFVICQTLNYPHRSRFCVALPGGPRYWKSEKHSEQARSQSYYDRIRVTISKRLNCHDRFLYSYVSLPNLRANYYIWLLHTMEIKNCSAFQAAGPHGDKQPGTFQPAVPVKQICIVEGSWSTWRTHANTGRACKLCTVKAQESAQSFLLLKQQFKPPDRCVSLTSAI